ncbi:hypothetical protein B0H13DRAFT_2069777 [Mycena leptocephala]|nr:hypothetical protein B0H13DRAFT_2069777 [Mycena leptocephala]
MKDGGSTRGVSACPLSVVHALLFSFISLADLGESGDEAGRSVGPVLRFPFFLAFLPPCYSTLPSTLRYPRRVLVGVFSSTHPTTLVVGAVFFLSFACDTSVVHAYHILGYSQCCSSSLCTMCARAYRTSYILSTRGVGGRLFSLVAFFSSRGRAGLRSRRLYRLSTISSFFCFLFFFRRGILISGCFWRYKYAMPCACAHALLVYFIFSYVFFPIFWRL